MDWNDLDALTLGEAQHVYDKPSELVDEGREFLRNLRRSPLRKALLNLARERNKEPTNWPEDRKTRSDHKKAAQAAWKYRDEISRASISLDSDELLTSLKFLERAIARYGQIPEVFEKLRTLGSANFEKYSLGLPIKLPSGPTSPVWKFYTAMEELVYVSQQ